MFEESWVEEPRFAESGVVEFFGNALWLDEPCAEESVPEVLGSEDGCCARQQAAASNSSIARKMARFILRIF